MNTSLGAYRFLPTGQMQAANRAGARKNYLKALRRAELAAWHGRGGRIDTPADPFHYAQAELIQQRRRERWLFALTAGLAATTIVLAFRETMQFSQHWADFMGFVQQV